LALGCLLPHCNRKPLPGCFPRGVVQVYSCTVTRFKANF
jgi:hypothetical protein